MTPFTSRKSIVGYDGISAMPSFLKACHLNLAVGIPGDHVGDQCLGIVIVTVGQQVEKVLPRSRKASRPESFRHEWPGRDLTEGLSHPLERRLRGLIGSEIALLFRIVAQVVQLFPYVSLTADIRPACFVQ
jgi:hypothetical protein